MCRAFLSLSLLLTLASPGLAVSENEVLAMALADARTLPRLRQITSRYVWLTDGELESLQALAFTVNAISRATLIQRPTPLNRWLARVDLADFAPKVQDLNEFVKTWEELRFEPRLNLLLTKDTLKFAAGLEIPKEKKTVKKVRQKLIAVEPYVAADGKTYNGKYVPEDYTEELEEPVFDANVIRVVSDHVDRKLLAELVDLTQSQAPLVSHGYLITRALTAVKDKDLFKTLYGGLYYEFAGIKRGFKKGTDEANFLAALGIGNVEQGIDVKKFFDNLPKDQRMALFRSRVTGKPRRVDVYPVGGRDNQGLVSFTHDLKRGSIDIGQHPLANLIDFRDDAREVIWEKLNGMHGFALFNNEGELQDEVPNTVASDTTVRAPFEPILQPAISCIRCHGKESGWQQAPNDVQRLLKGRIDLFGDLLQNRNPRQDLERLVGLYAGDLERKTFLRGRNDYTNAVSLATGRWLKSKDQLDSVKLASEKVAAIYAAHNWDSINAARVLRDLGVATLEKGKEAEQLARLIPPVPVVIDGRIPEDFRVAALLQGMDINRTEYDMVYSIMARRFQATKGTK